MNSRRGPGGSDGPGAPGRIGAPDSPDSLVVRTPEDLRRLMQTSFTLTDQQWEIVSAPLAPAVVIAGAGSGKTSVMAARVIYLVANGLVRPDQVLGLTFTTKAAAELRGKVLRSLAVAGFRSDLGAGSGDELDEVAQPTVTTYNAYAARLLTEHGLRIGFEPDSRVMADGSRYQVAGRAVARHRGTVRSLSDHPPTVIENILALDAQLSEHLVTPDRVREFDRGIRIEAVGSLAVAKGDLPKLIHAIDRRAELLELVEGYRALKAQWGLIDFSDQIALAADLARLHADVGRLERARYALVLLDEYQDTSVAQAELLARLFSGSLADDGIGQGRGHPVTAVGDPHQAIYGWRGASVSNILNFGRQFPASDERPAPRQYSLTISQRSDARILRLANELAGPLMADQRLVRQLQARPDAADGEVRTVVWETYADELAWLTEEVLAVHREGTPWPEIGVLTRDNDHAADVFDSLSRAGVPVEIVGLKGLLTLPEVSEVIAILTLLVDPTVNAALLQVLSGPRWAIGPRDLALLGARARELAGSRPLGRAAGPGTSSLTDELAAAVGDVDPVEVVALSDALDAPSPAGASGPPYSSAARERFALLAAELRMLRGHAGEALVDLVRRIIDVCGIDVELASSVSEAARARRDNLDLFVKAVADFSSVDGSVSLPALLAYLQAEDELGTGLDVATPSEADSVKLLTVHRAKGLEFDVVFLPGMCAERFPNTRGRTQWTGGPAVLPIPLRGDESDLPRLAEVSAAGLKDFREQAREHQAVEELRLGYVAVTRARHRLFASSYLWTESRASALGPSPYQLVI
ncbi:MAG: ATP-dependent helicase, partial [Nocardioides sp.]